MTTYAITFTGSPKKVEEEINEMMLDALECNTEIMVHSASVIGNEDGSITAFIFYSEKVKNENC